MMKYSYFQKAIGIVLTAIICLTAGACSNAAPSSDSDTIVSSSDIVSWPEINGNPAPVPTPEELMEPATHIMFALCTGVYMDDEDPGQVLFYFLPVKCILGELEQVSLDTNLAYYGYKAILVKGSVNDYQLDNVYATGNSYVLWLTEVRSADGSEETTYYTDLLPYSDVVRLEEFQTLYYSESYVSELMLTGDIWLEKIERYIQGRQESENESQLSSSDVTTQSETPN